MDLHPFYGQNLQFSCQTKIIQPSAHTWLCIEIVNNVFSIPYGISGLPKTWIMPDELFGDILFGFFYIIKRGEWCSTVPEAPEMFWIFHFWVNCPFNRSYPERNSLFKKIHSQDRSTDSGTRHLLPSLSRSRSQTLSSDQRRRVWIPESAGKTLLQLVFSKDRTEHGGWYQGSFTSQHVYRMKNNCMAG